MSKFKDILILIPTINESTLEQVVSSVCNQAADAEIVILGFGKANQIADKYEVKFCDLGEKTPKPIALNGAIRESKKNWIIVLDADAVPKSNWAENMLRAFQKERSIFSGSAEIGTGTFWMRVYNLSMLHEFSSEKPSGTRKYLPAMTLGFTREAYKEIGPFSEEINRSEDFEWTLRAYSKGFSPFFEPSACVTHIPVNKFSFSTVWDYWRISGYDNWLVRQKYQEILNTPFLFRWPLFILMTAPLLSLLPTLRIFYNSPRLFLKNLLLIPFVYFTKLAWCLGVYEGAKK